MNIWSKMIAALQGELTETEESLADRQALHILDNEVSRVAVELQRSRDALAELMANQLQAATEVQQCQATITELESYAFQAIAQKNESLAMDVAEKIVEMESQTEHKTEILNSYRSSVKTLQRMIVQADLNLKRLKQQLAILKATESVQRAQAAIAARPSDGKPSMHTAQESLERLKQRQAKKAAQFQVTQEIEGSARKDALLEKLENAGIKTSSTKAIDVLNRLKQE